MPRITPDQQKRIDDATHHFRHALEQIATRGVQPGGASSDLILSFADEFARELSNLSDYGQPNFPLEKRSADQMAAVLLAAEIMSFPLAAGRRGFPSLPAYPVESAPIAALAVILTRDIGVEVVGENGRPTGNVLLNMKFEQDPNDTSPEALEKGHTTEPITVPNYRY